MRRAFLIAVMVGFIAGAAAADEIGSVTYVEGYPEVVREGKLVYEEIDFGFRLENFDSIRTNDESSMEIDFDPGTGIDGSVSVDPGTHFYVDLSDLRSEQTGTIELVVGSVEVAARRLTGRSRFQVRTNAATMGVRGTVFSVTGGPGGELLVSTEEGLVEVTDEGGRTLYASPGEAVEVDEETSVFRSLKYDRDQVEAFRSEWRARRAALFAERAPQILGFYGRRYFRVREHFIDAYGSLMGQRDVIDEWMDEARRGVRPGPGDRVERAELVAALLRVRGAMVRFEPILARLDKMAPYVRELAADVELRDGLTAADLYRTVNNDRRVMAERLATVRHVLKLFAQRNDGIVPFE